MKSLTGWQEKTNKETKNITEKIKMVDWSPNISIIILNVNSIIQFYNCITIVL